MSLAPIRLLALTIFATLALAGAAQATIRGTFHVKFDAASTLHEFSGEAPPAAFAVEESPERIAGREAWGAALAVEVAALSTGSGLRDAKMRSMFEAERYPRIDAAIGDLAAGELKAGSEIPFDLRIRAVTRRLIGRVTRWQASDRAATFRVEFDVSLADYDLDPPRALFVTVDDRVHVTVDVDARLEAAAPR